MILKQRYLMVIFVLVALLSISAFRNIADNSQFEEIEVWGDLSQNYDPKPTPRATVFSDDFTEPTTF